MINKTILVGYLGSDPELFTTQAGIAVGKFSLATKETWKDKEGKKQEDTTWHKITTFGKHAEMVCQIFKKGDLCYVEGGIRMNKYTDKQGVERVGFEIKATTTRKLNAKDGGRAGGGNYQPAPTEEGNFGDMEDIPF